MSYENEERREKALAQAASWWGQWQWYDIRRPVLYALIAGERTLEENQNKYIGAKAMLMLLLDMEGEEIEDYCKAHVDWLLDDLALDVCIGPMTSTPWIDGPRSVTDEM